MALTVPQGTAWVLPERSERLSPRLIAVLALLFLALMLVFPLMTSRAEEPTAAPLDPQSQMEAAMLTRINEVRAQYGLHPFTYNGQLADAAATHVAEGASRNWLSHRGANGSSYYDRVALTGYLADKVNECIGWGYNQERMLTWWLNSPVHRSILLSPTYTEVGIGYEGNPAARWGHWWVLKAASK